MTTVTVQYGVLVVVSERIDDRSAFTCRLEIALAHVRGALLPDLAADDASWHRAQPTSGPGVFGAGAFRRSNGTLYWEVQDPTKAVAIELLDAGHARLLVEADDPAAAVAQINRALARRQAEAREETNR
jgi:hypothetical protein